MPLLLWRFLLLGCEDIRDVNDIGQIPAIEPDTNFGLGPSKIGPQLIETFLLSTPLALRDDQQMFIRVVSTLEHRHIHWNLSAGSAPPLTSNSVLWVCLDLLGLVPKTQQPLDQLLDNTLLGIGSHLAL